MASVDNEAFSLGFIWANNFSGLKLQYALGLRSLFQMCYTCTQPSCTHLSMFSLIEIVNMTLGIINMILDQRMNRLENLAYEIWKMRKNLLGKISY
jgi:hypothetical protein